MVATADLLHFMQDDVEGDLLLIEEYKLPAQPDLVGGDGEQFLAGFSVERI